MGEKGRKCNFFQRKPLHKLYIRILFPHYDVLNDTESEIRMENAQNCEAALRERFEEPRRYGNLLFLSQRFRILFADFLFFPTVPDTSLIQYLELLLLTLLGFSFGAQFKINLKELDISSRVESSQMTLQNFFNHSSNFVSSSFCLDIF